MAAEEYEVQRLQVQIYELIDTIRELEARIEKLESERHPPPPPLPPMPTPYLPPNTYGSSHCPRCGIDWSGPMGYVCYDDKCPMRFNVTC